MELDGTTTEAPLYMPFDKAKISKIKSGFAWTNRISYDNGGKWYEFIATKTETKIFINNIDHNKFTETLQNIVDGAENPTTTAAEKTSIAKDLLFLQKLYEDTMARLKALGDTQEFNISNILWSHPVCK